ncbi:mannose-1-phosphate guanylyltransferase [Paenibacillus elgii]|uniref:Mannose-1-phosphate guanylyltransferase n=1 Tax=Paenibacillus elgii TaxID=189691 RepID=A0A2T6FRU8_9BACL|nr:sugar phosphate nucleotidyltransferase [Paenibacillus elgii]PUA34630.1 mannose-1-phosphate guanylyltransferase [Paenibacillus elgii]
MLEIGLHEVIIVLPIDLFVENDFITLLPTLEKSLINSNADIGLVGLKPNHPSDKYGYILPVNTTEQPFEYQNVDSFIEKPTIEYASELIKQGALWNSGIVAFKLDFITSRLENSGHPIGYNELFSQYESLNNTSFDYEILEHTKKIISISYDGSWKYLGTWDSFTEEIYSSKIGLGSFTEDSINTHLINNLTIPVAVLGISNAVIVACDEGILVANKGSSNSLKELLPQFIDLCNKREYPWGEVRIIDRRQEVTGKQLILKRVYIKSGCYKIATMDNITSKTWLILSGSGYLQLEGQRNCLTIGQIIQIPLRQRKRLIAEVDIELIEIKFGEVIWDDDLNPYHDLSEVSF